MSIYTHGFGAASGNLPAKPDSWAAAFALLPVRGVVSLLHALPVNAEPHGKRKCGRASWNGRAPAASLGDFEHAEEHKRDDSERAYVVGCRVSVEASLSRDLALLFGRERRLGIRGLVHVLGAWVGLRRIRQAEQVVRGHAERDGQPSDNGRPRLARLGFVPADIRRIQADVVGKLGLRPALGLARRPKPHAVEASHDTLALFFRRHCAAVSTGNLAACEYRLRQSCAFSAFGVPQAEF